VANETTNEEKQAAPTGGKSGATLRITWVKSAIGVKFDQGATIRSLGFHRLNEVVERPDSPTLRGMISKVKHLVNVEIV
jgi:large subunit ribosomal protein L30